MSNGSKLNVAVETNATAAAEFCTRVLLICALAMLANVPPMATRPASAHTRFALVAVKRRSGADR